MESSKESARSSGGVSESGGERNRGAAEGEEVKRRGREGTEIGGGAENWEGKRRGSTGGVD